MLDVPFAALGIAGPVAHAIPIEADGKPGAEWLLIANPFSLERRILYPVSPRGVCLSASFTVNMDDAFTDVDGDGKAERVRFDWQQQRVMVWPLPTCER